MGLRPSGNNEPNNGGTFDRSTQSSMGPSNSNNDQSSSSSRDDSQQSAPSAPQREAWTARGQLLLNFHHAISRAINSPEMAQKCSNIARDMSFRSDEEQHASQGAAGVTTEPIPASASSAQSKSTVEPSHATTAEEYGAEAALIVENKSKRDASVRNKSLAVGVFSFVALRSGRGLSSWMRKSLANRASKSYAFDAMPVGSSLGLGKHTSNKLAGSTPAADAKRPTVLRKVLGVSFDVTISSTLALLSGTFLFMPRPSAYIEDMAQLPLVQGKSVYAEMVCPPLLKEYRRVLEQYGGRWPVMGSSTQEDVSLNVIRTFVENCSKRSKYERALLDERNALAGLADDNEESTMARLMKRMPGRDPKGDGDLVERPVGNNSKLGTVSVPSPGVPKGTPVNIDLDVFDLAAASDEVDVAKEEDGNVGGT